MLELDAFSRTISAFDPASVNEPYVDLMILHFLGEELGVAGRVKHEEWRTEASRESGGWFGNAHLGSSNLRGVAGNEVIHSLLFAKLGDGWKNAEGIASEEDDIGRMSRDTGNESVVDELDRVSSTGVLWE